ncbi:glycosyltransferase [Oceaniglobus roseus]|uniref:glycosyltransferase n=1 Tax=Oceaniglobus roseus TaxID=1737570 RepID=UPI0015625210|nr:glycosyltransferase [Kandeliimicrobium roseum]
MAIIHYWLVGMRGGEKVLESLSTMFPQADIFTHAYVPAKISEKLRRHRVIVTSVGRLPMAHRLYQKYLPFMPAALDALDLSGYDLVLSSEAGPAKGVITPVDTPHLCYCHSPMRYIWDQYPVYRANAGFLTRQLMPAMARRMRAWDVATAGRPDRIVANSNHVARRVEKFWRRDAEVIHPPVAVDQFRPVAADQRGGYYLWLGELAPYKRPDLAVEAFTRLKRPLFVIGGPDAAEAELARRAGDTVRFLGRVDDARLRRYLAGCRALIFPGEEDFGIVPVEAMASGRPVIAYGRGGALDSVVDGETGLLFDTQSVDSLVDAVERFEASGLEQADPQRFVRHAATFAEPIFRQKMARVLMEMGVEGGVRPSYVAAAE